MKPMNRYCPLVFDEKTLRPHVTEAGRGKRVGGLEDFREGQTKSKRIADHALMFMLRGINVNWKQPVAFYLTIRC